MSPSNPVLLNAVANSGTKISATVAAQFLFSGSIQASFTDATAAGTLTLEGSLDQANPTNWDIVKNGTISASATVASGALTTISMQWLNYKWLRVKWVQSGGAGTITVNGYFQSTV